MRSLAAIAALVALAPTGHASAQIDVAIEGRSLRITTPEGPRTVDIGCVATQALVSGGSVYAACGSDGMIRVGVDDAGVVVHRAALGAPVAGVMIVDGVPWARLGDGSLRRLQPAVDELDSAPGPAAPAPAGPVGHPEGWNSSDAPPPGGRPRSTRAAADRPPAPIGRVTRVEGGYALITLEREDGVERGVTVEFLRRPRSTALQLENEREDLESVGRGIVEATSGTVARVRVEVDTQAQPAMWVRPTTAGGLLLLPPEPVGMAMVSFRLRPFIPMGILGFGAINDVSIGYTTDFGLAVRLEANGFAFGFARRAYADTEHMPLMPVVHGYVGAVTRWFEIGLGLGWSRSFRARAPEGDQFNEGFSALTMLRVGTEDGLSLRVRFTLLVREVWEVGDLYFDGRVPVTHGVWIIAGGGGGNTGVRYGEAGVRFLVIGNGLGGSVFLHGTVGVGMIEQGPNFSNAGPMVGLGLDARL